MHHRQIRTRSVLGSDRSRFRYGKGERGYRLGGGCGGFGRRSILTHGVSGGCPAAKLFATPTFPPQVIGGQSI